MRVAESKHTHTQARAMEDLKRRNRGGATVIISDGNSPHKTSLARRPLLLSAGTGGDDRDRGAGMLTIWHHASSRPVKLNPLPPGVVRVNYWRPAKKKVKEYAAGLALMFHRYYKPVCRLAMQEEARLE